MAYGDSDPTANLVSSTDDNLIERCAADLRGAFFYGASIWPSPIDNLGLVDTVLGRVIEILANLIFQPIFDVSTALLKPGHAIDHVNRQIEAVSLVVNGELKRGVDTAELLIAADMEVVMIGATIGEFVDQPRVAVEVKDDGLLGVKMLSKSRSERPCGWSVLGHHVNRSTTLTKRILRSGKRSRSIATAASASIVATSPPLATTTSGSPS